MTKDSQTAPYGTLLFFFSLLVARHACLFHQGERNWEGHEKCQRCHPKRCLTYAPSTVDAFCRIPIHLRNGDGHRGDRRHLSPRTLRLSCQRRTEKYFTGILAMVQKCPPKFTCWHLIASAIVWRCRAFKWGLTCKAVDLDPPSMGSRDWVHPLPPLPCEDTEFFPFCPFCPFCSFHHVRTTRWCHQWQMGLYQIWNLLCLDIWLPTSRTVKKCISAHYNLPSLRYFMTAPQNRPRQQSFSTIVH